MSRIAYVNGRYVPQRRAAVNVEDRGFQFADGVYEVVYLRRGDRLVDEGLHLDRLDRSLRELRLRPPMAQAALRAVLLEVARRNRIADGLIYVQVTRGVARRDHAFPDPMPEPSVVVTVRRVPPYPTDIGRWTARAITHPDQRWERRDIKSTNLLPNVLARQAARERGVNEAILYDSAGMVTEGAATSFWIVDREGVLRAPPLGNAILPGCTRAALTALLDEEAIELREEAFSLEELRGAREAFLTSATGFVRPILEVDGEPVGEGTVGPVSRRLFALFSRHVLGGSNRG